MAYVRRDSAMSGTDSFGQPKDLPRKWESNEVRQVKAQHETAVHGMSNEEVWTLVRRWDKVLFSMVFLELDTFLDDNRLIYP